MRVVVCRVRPVRIHGGEVLDLQLDEGGGKLGSIAEIEGEGVCKGSSVIAYADKRRSFLTCLEFELPSENVH